MAAILLAFEENKVRHDADNKQDFNKFLKDFVSEKNVDDSDDEEEEDADDPEDPGKINGEIGKKIRTFFQKFIEDQKKPKRVEVNPFLTILSNDHPEKQIKWTTIRNYVWSIVTNNIRKAKAKVEEKKEKKTAKKPRKKGENKE